MLTEEERLLPAVPFRRSVTPEAIFCLECGKRNSMLKRHLGHEHDLSPDQYRGKWRLPQEYPMAAPAYAAARSKMAKGMELGRRAQTPASVAPETLTGRGTRPGDLAPNGCS
ncbi:MucR family transcriptional regulator [Azospirillum sp. A1-3]|nr:MucR family transcriptional regulator [Azospirillum sp. A1-3]